MKAKLKAINANANTAMRNQGFADGRGDRPKRFPNDSIYMTSYRRGQEAKNA